MIDSNAIKVALTTFLRGIISAALGGVATWATSKGFDISGELPIIIGALALFLVNIAWGIGTRLLKKWELTLGLQLEPGATHEDVHAIAQTVSPFTRISEAIKVPTNPADAVTKPLEVTNESTNSSPRIQ